MTPQTILFKREAGQVTFQPNIGLDASSRQSVVDMLKILLADEMVLSDKMCPPHQHPEETKISEMQALYDDQHKQIIVISKEIIERIHILGGLHLDESEKEIASSRLVGGEFLTVPRVISILADQEAFIRFLREDARKCSEIYDDQGTFTQLVGILRLHEKMAWMIRSFIGPELIDAEKNRAFFPVQAEHPLLP